MHGVDRSKGSLCQGTSAACCMALSGKISDESYKVYAILGDGETQEGQVWEAAMFAAHYNRAKNKPIDTAPTAPIGLYISLSTPNRSYALSDNHSCATYAHGYANLSPPSHKVVKTPSCRKSPLYPYVPEFLPYARQCPAYL